MHTAADRAQLVMLILLTATACVLTVKTVHTGAATPCVWPANCFASPGLTSPRLQSGKRSGSGPSAAAQQPGWPSSLGRSSGHCHRSLVAQGTSRALCVSGLTAVLVAAAFSCAISSCKAYVSLDDGSGFCSSISKFKPEPLMLYAAIANAIRLCFIC